MKNKTLIVALSEFSTLTRSKAFMNCSHSASVPPRRAESRSRARAATSARMSCTARTRGSGTPARATMVERRS